MTGLTTFPDELVRGVLTDPTAVVINGCGRMSTTDRLPLVSPIDGQTWTDVAVGGAQDALDAADGAASALAEWSAVNAATRANVLRCIATDLDSAASSVDWPTLISRETGKRLVESRGELELSAMYFRVFADLVARQREVRFDVVAGTTHEVQVQPVGVVAVLTPWNFPVSIPARKVAAALAAGCTTVFKPSELAPLSSMVLAAVVERHVPSGVLNTVLGEPADVVDPWLHHEAVRAVSFTGSTRVGRLVAAGAAPRFLRTVMELGGCAPFVVLADADPERAAATLLVAKYRNNGQSCIAANQVFVAEEVADDFIDAFAAATQRLVVGDPLDEATGLGPVAPAGDPARLTALVRAAAGTGARVVTEALELPERGHYVTPAVLVDVPPTAAVFREEIFGPVAAIRRFTDVAEAVEAHRSTGYGLAAYVCGTDLDRAHEVAGRLCAGIVGINTGTPNYPGAPFGGVGLSGVGYEGGQQGLDAFQVFRTVGTREA